MANRGIKRLLLKKGEVADLLGFKRTNGYRYVDYLMENDFIKPRFLPGIKSPRFLQDEVEEILLEMAHKGAPTFGNATRKK